jgi:phosphodiesterase/alkaline phosphatase D-like protein
VSFTARNGLYRSFRWGRNLEVFFLDERSFRSPKASANGVCDNPQTGSPDLAPTAPQSSRNLFSLVVPSLSAPVSEQCLATINDPSRTLLGARQYRRFTRAVRGSKATWKVIMNEVPIQQFYALPYDRWEGYAAERTKLLTFLRDNVDNVVFLTTDVHANFVNDARLQTLEEGGPVNSGILDVTTGPVATKNFELEIEDSTGSPGSGALITQAFFKTPPPGGVGMICAAPNVFSYGQVTVTGQELTIELKDDKGDPVVDRGTGTPCETIRLEAAQG